MLTANLRRTLALTKIKLVTPLSIRCFSSDNFLNGANANYIDQMFSAWQKDPKSVHASWQAYFSGSSFEEPPSLGLTHE